MSRWSVLASARSGHREDITANASSIHSFQGFNNVLKSKKTIWKEFVLVVPVEDLLLHQGEGGGMELLSSVCDQYLANSIDCNECVVEIVNISDATRSWLSDLIEVGMREDRLRWYDSETGLRPHTSAIKVYYQNKQLASIFPQCIYRVYEAACSEAGSSSNSVSDVRVMSVFTREKSERATIKASDLLSHRNVGVDNTGNVRIWPAEQILTQVVLRNERVQQLFRSDPTRTKLLELGGGMTALCGLSLAIGGVTDSVVLTDGHPHCVLNQVPNLCQLVLYPHNILAS
jgi:hypothetical protein